MEFPVLRSVAKVIRTSGDTKTGEQWKELDDIAVEGGKFTANLKANSITTFVVE